MTTPAPRGRAGSALPAWHPPRRSALHLATLLALAATTATPAWAQADQVQLFGTIDLALGRFKGAPTGVNARDAGNSQLTNGGMTTSFFGLRGSDDLGGGLLAQFELASFLRADTGQNGRSDAIGPPVNVAADTFWARAAWVGLSSARYGRLRLGNNSTLLFVQSITSNAFGDSTVFSPLNLVTFIGSPLSGGTGWTNQVMVDSPRWNGFSASAAVSLSEGQGGQNRALRAAWANGPGAVSLAWQSVDRNPATFADGTSANNTRAWQLAGSYDFQRVKLFAHVGQIRNRGTEAAPVDVGYRLWEASASVPLGSNGRLLLGHARRSTGDTPAPVPATAAGGNLVRSVTSIGYDHDLSRRTDLYLVALRDSTTTRTLPAPPSSVSASGQALAIGMRHRF